MDTKDRIKQIMENLQLSQQEFAARLGISPATLSNVFLGRTNPTNNHVMAIHNAFPNININWLLFGEGEMVTNQPSSDSEMDENSSETDTPLFRQERIDLPTTIETVSSALSQNPFARQQNTKTANYRKQNDGSPVSPPQNVEVRQRTIREIRVFYDDGTYETFTP